MRCARRSPSSCRCRRRCFRRSSRRTAALKFRIAEVIREKLTLELNQEVPYGIAVEVEQLVEEDGQLESQAIIWVDREGQKPIVIGPKGERLKRVGRSARLELNELLGRRMHLRCGSRCARTGRTTRARSSSSAWSEARHERHAGARSSTPGYVLHHQPYRDTSRILEVFTATSGGCTLFARGVRGPKARLGFGAAAVPAAAAVVERQRRSAAAHRRGRRRCRGAAAGREPDGGFYLNELMLKLTTRHDPARGSSTSITRRSKP